MSFVDSKAVFRKRVSDLGLTELLPEFERQGWATFGSFTFAGLGQPPGTNDKEFTSLVLDALSPGDTSLHASIRRLHFEAYSITMGDLKRRSDTGEQDSLPRVMPQPEKADRFNAIRAEYPSIVFDEVLEPSDHLVDRYHSMQERGALKYVPWHELGRKDLELEGEKQDMTFKPDKAGVLKLAVETAAPTPIDVGTIYKLEKALYRRGVAMHMAALLNFGEHEKLIKWFFREMEREAIPGYDKVSIDQIGRVDREIFRRLAEETRSGLGLSQDGSYPLSAHLANVMREPRVITLMQPLPRKQASASSGDPQKRTADTAELEKLRAEVKALKANPQQTQKGGGKKKNPPASAAPKGGKGAGRGGAKGPMLPSELRAYSGLMAKYKERPICFGYNMKIGCRNSVNNVNECPKGKHICMKCGGDHPVHYAGCPRTPPPL